MSGYLGQWCSDAFDPGYYERSPHGNPQGPEVPADRTDPVPRALRGKAAASSGPVLYMAEQAWARRSSLPMLVYNPAEGWVDISYDLLTSMKTKFGLDPAQMLGAEYEPDYAALAAYSSHQTGIRLVKEGSVGGTP
jgi:hypothetical protein